MTRPETGVGNPYEALLNGALERAGVVLERTEITHRAAFLTDASAVVLAWPEYLFQKKRTGFSRIVRAHLGVWAVVLLVAILKARCVRVVFFVHNERPHDPAAPRVQTWIIRWLLKVSDVVVVHSMWAARRVQALGASSDRVVVIPHGNYISTLAPRVVDRPQIRASYGFSDDTRVLLAFGQMRGYKRLEALARDLAESDLERICVWIVGTPVEERVIDEILVALASHPRMSARVRVDARDIPDDEVADLLTAADVALFNQETIFTSGSLVLALSAGLPVVAPANGSAPEVVGPGAGELVGADVTLVEAVRRVLVADAGVSRDAALNSARRLRWDDAARELVTRLWDYEPAS
jgi:beta-1,4-mannosyltransferase